jgi:hypothetical protein
VGRRFQKIFPVRAFDASLGTSDPEFLRVQEVANWFERFASTQRGFRLVSDNTVGFERTRKYHNPQLGTPSQVSLEHFSHWLKVGNGILREERVALRYCKRALGQIRILDVNSLRPKQAIVTFAVETKSTLVAEELFRDGLDRPDSGVTSQERAAQFQYLDATGWRVRL